MIEHTVGCCLGCNDDASNGCTGGAIRADVTKDMIFFALTLGQDLRRTAAVTIYCPNAAQGNHGLTHLERSQAQSIRSISAFRLYDYQRTIRLDADHGTVGAGRSVFRSICRLAVLYCKAKVAGQGMQLVALQRLFGGTQLAATGTILILNNCQVSIAVVVITLTGSCKHLSVVYQEAGRCGRGISKGSVHTCNHIVPQLIAVVVHGSFGGNSTPVLGICQVLVDSVITGQDHNIIIHGVYFDNMKYLPTGTLLIVNDQFGFRYTVTKDIVLLGNDGVVVVADGLIIVGADPDRQNIATQFTSALTLIAYHSPSLMDVTAINTGLNAGGLTAAADVMLHAFLDTAAYIVRCFNKSV